MEMLAFGAGGLEFCIRIWDSDSIWRYMASYEVGNNLLYTHIMINIRVLIAPRP